MSTPPATRHLSLPQVLVGYSRNGNERVKALPKKNSKDDKFCSNLPSEPRTAHAISSLTSNSGISLSTDTIRIIKSIIDYPHLSPDLPESSLAATSAKILEQDLFYPSSQEVDLNIKQPTTFNEKATLDALPPLSIITNSLCSRKYAPEHIEKQIKQREKTPSTYSVPNFNNISFLINPRPPEEKLVLTPSVQKSLMSTGNESTISGSSADKVSLSDKSHKVSSLDLGDLSQQGYKVNVEIYEKPSSVSNNKYKVQEQVPVSPQKRISLNAAEAQENVELSRATCDLKKKASSDAISADDTSKPTEMSPIKKRAMQTTLRDICDKSMYDLPKIIEEAGVKSSLKGATYPASEKTLTRSKKLKIDKELKQNLKASSNCAIAEKTSMTGIEPIKTGNSTSKHDSEISKEQNSKESLHFEELPCSLKPRKRIAHHPKATVPVQSQPTNNLRPSSTSISEFRGKIQTSTSSNTHEIEKDKTQQINSDHRKQDSNEMDAVGMKKSKVEQQLSKVQKNTTAHKIRGSCNDLRSKLKKRMLSKDIHLSIALKESLNKSQNRTESSEGNLNHLYAKKSVGETASTAKDYQQEEESGSKLKSQALAKCYIKSSTLKPQETVSSTSSSSVKSGSKTSSSYSKLKTRSCSTSSTSESMTVNFSDNEKSTLNKNNEKVQHGNCDSTKHVHNVLGSPQSQSPCFSSQNEEVQNDCLGDDKVSSTVNNEMAEKHSMHNKNENNNNQAPTETNKLCEGVSKESKKTRKVCTESNGKVQQSDNNESNSCIEATVVQIHESIETKKIKTDSVKKSKKLRNEETNKQRKCQGVEDNQSNNNKEKMQCKIDGIGVSNSKTNNTSILSDSGSKSQDKQCYKKRKKSCDVPSSEKKKIRVSSETRSRKKDEAQEKESRKRTEKNKGTCSSERSSSKDKTGEMVHKSRDKIKNNVRRKSSTSHNSAKHAKSHNSEVTSKSERNMQDQKEKRKSDDDNESPNSVESSKSKEKSTPDMSSAKDNASDNELVSKLQAPSNVEGKIYSKNIEDAPLTQTDVNSYLPENHNKIPNKFTYLKSKTHADDGQVLRAANITSSNEQGMQHENKNNSTAEQCEVENIMLDLWGSDFPVNKHKTPPGKLNKRVLFPDKDIIQITPHVPMEILDTETETNELVSQVFETSVDLFNTQNEVDPDNQFSSLDKLPVPEEAQEHPELLAQVLEQPEQGQQILEVSEVADTSETSNLNEDEKIKTPEVVLENPQINKEICEDFVLSSDEEGDKNSVKSKIKNYTSRDGLVKKSESEKDDEESDQSKEQDLLELDELSNASTVEAPDNKLNKLSKNFMFKAFTFNCFSDEEQEPSTSSDNVPDPGGKEPIVIDLIDDDILPEDIIINKNDIKKLRETIKSKLTSLQTGEYRKKVLSEYKNKPSECIDIADDDDAEMETIEYENTTIIVQDQETSNLTTDINAEDRFTSTSLPIEDESPVTRKTPTIQLESNTHPVLTERSPNREHNKSVASSSNCESSMINVASVTESNDCDDNNKVAEVSHTRRENERFNQIISQLDKFAKNPHVNKVLVTYVNKKLAMRAETDSGKNGYLGININSYFRFIFSVYWIVLIHEPIRHMLKGSSDLIKSSNALAETEFQEKVVDLLTTYYKPKQSKTYIPPKSLHELLATMQDYFKEQEELFVNVFTSSSLFDLFTQKDDYIDLDSSLIDLSKKKLITQNGKDLIERNSTEIENAENIISMSSSVIIEVICMEENEQSGKKVESLSKNGKNCTQPNETLQNADTIITIHCTDKSSPREETQINNNNVGSDLETVLLQDESENRLVVGCNENSGSEYILSQNCHGEIDPQTKESEAITLQEQVEVCAENLSTKTTEPLANLETAGTGDRNIVTDSLVNQTCEESAPEVAQPHENQILAIGGDANVTTTISNQTVTLHDRLPALESNENQLGEEYQLITPVSTPDTVPASEIVSPILQRDLVSASEVDKPPVNVSIFSDNTTPLITNIVPVPHNSQVHASVMQGLDRPFNIAHLSHMTPQQVSPVHPEQIHRETRRRYPPDESIILAANNPFDDACISPENINKTRNAGDGSRVNFIADQLKISKQNTAESAMQKVLTQAPRGHSVPNLPMALNRNSNLQSLSEIVQSMSPIPLTLSRKSQIQPARPPQLVLNNPPGRMIGAPYGLMPANQNPRMNQESMLTNQARTPVVSGSVRQEAINAAAEVVRAAAAKKPRKPRRKKSDPVPPTLPNIPEPMHPGFMLQNPMFSHCNSFQLEKTVINRVCKEPILDINDFNAFVTNQQCSNSPMHMQQLMYWTYRHLYGSPELNTFLSFGLQDKMDYAMTYMVHRYMLYNSTDVNQPQPHFRTCHLPATATATQSQASGPPASSLQSRNYSVSNQASSVSQVVQAASKTLPSSSHARVETQITPPHISTNKPHHLNRSGGSRANNATVTNIPLQSPLTAAVALSTPREPPLLLGSPQLGGGQNINPHVRMQAGQPFTIESNAGYLNHCVNNNGLQVIREPPIAKSSLINNKSLYENSQKTDRNFQISPGHPCYGYPPIPKPPNVTANLNLSRTSQQQHNFELSHRMERYSNSLHFNPTMTTLGRNQVDVAATTLVPFSSLQHSNPLRRGPVSYERHAENQITQVQPNVPQALALQRMLNRRPSVEQASSVEEIPQGLIRSTGPEVYKQRICVCSKLASHCCGCYKAFYCSEACQERDWNIKHMLECRKANYDRSAPQQ